MGSLNGCGGRLDGAFFLEEGQRAGKSSACNDWVILKIVISRKLRLPLGSFPRQAATLFTSPYFLVKSDPNHLPYNRYGVIIRAHTITTAVGRHLFKRRIMGIFRQWPSYGRDFLVITRDGAARASLASLREACENAKAKLTNDL